MDGMGRITKKEKASKGGRKKGRRQARKVGRKEGRKKGRKKMYWKEGKAKARKERGRYLLDRGLPQPFLRVNLVHRSEDALVMAAAAVK